MKIKFTTNYQTQLESIFSQAGYLVRYEKGNFNSGYCILNQKKVVVVNKYYTTEGKINCLIDILRQVDWDFSQLEEKEKKLYEDIKKKS
ncbi:MAG: hypothetical protein HC880_20510 [Bacteroidia bacterium]|nr:hypothetical protein [Bacteroidia bacterium]